MPLFYVHDAPSTQEAAKSLLGLLSADVSFWQQAGSQSDGRGQRGRRWHSLPGNLYLTGCLPVSARLHPGQVAIIVGVALARTLESLGIGDVSLKWPNDLLIGHKKCGGILIEKAEKYLIGIGVNVATFPENAETPATALSSYGAFDLREISLNARNGVTAALADFNDFEAIKNQWWVFAKKSVSSWIVREKIDGEIIGVDDLGRLLIRMADGSLKTRHARL